jgi:hypothetical protein
MDRRGFFVGAAAAAPAPFALAASGKAEKLPQDGVEWFTNVEVKTRDGQTLRFYDDGMKGKTSSSTSSSPSAMRSVP